MGMQSDIRLLLAVLAPLAGAGLVMAAGKKPNLREACSFCAAAVALPLVVSMVPAVRAGKTLHFTVFAAAARPERVAARRRAVDDFCR